MNLTINPENVALAESSMYEDLEKLKARLRVLQKAAFERRKRENGLFCAAAYSGPVREEYLTGLNVYTADDNVLLFNEVVKLRRSQEAAVRQ